TLWIAGHNFENHSMKWEYSSDGSTWYEAAVWYQSDNTDILKTLVSAINTAYWRIQVEAISAPQCAEIVLSKSYSFNIQARPDPIHAWTSNVVWSKSIGGQERGIKLGDKQATRIYTLRLDDTTRANMRTIYTDLDGFSKPFLCKDAE
ncbi:unnamed protein product, partial [marine sediment metagenome]